MIIATDWTKEFLRARLRAETAIDRAPKGMASVAAAQRMALLTIVSRMNGGAIAPDEATRLLERIPEAVAGG